MSLSADEKQLLREAIGVARGGAPRALDDALRILNEQVLDDTYQYSLIGAANIDEAERRADAVFPGAYTSAWAALRRELAIAPPIGGPVSPDPEPVEESYPHPPVVEVPEGDEFAAAVLQVLAQNGLYLRDGCVGVGGFDARSAARLQVFGDPWVGDASIQFTNNKGAVAVQSLAGDGGLRDLNNHRLVREPVDDFDPDAGKAFKNSLEVVKNDRTSSQVGTDSKHQFSIKRVEPGYPHQYTQDAVFVIDEQNQTAGWKLYRTGWKMVNAVDSKYGPEKFFRPVFE